MLKRTSLRPWIMLGVTLCTIVSFCSITMIHVNTKDQYTARSKANASGQVKQQFLVQLLPATTAVNARIYNDRQKISALFAKPTHSAVERQWLYRIAAHYDLKNWSHTSRSARQDLLSRVDIVPNSLVLAHAASTSNWNLCSLHALSNPGYANLSCRQQCASNAHQLHPAVGHKPKTRCLNNQHTQELVRSHVHHLNTHPKFKQLRQSRQQLRERNKPLTGLKLAIQLAASSLHDGRYVRTLQHTIASHQLERFDHIWHEIKTTNS